MARLVFNLAVLALAIWFLWAVLADIGFKAVGDRILGASLPIMAAVLAVNVLRFMLLGLRWEILVRGEAPLGFRPVLEILMAGNLLALITPAVRVAGPVLRAYYLSKETGRPRARFYGTIVADQTANFSAFAAAMIVSGILTALEGRAGLSVAAGLALLFALVGGLYVGKRHLERLASGRPSVARTILRGAVLSRAVERWDRRHLATRFLTWWEHLLEALAGSLIGKRTWWPAFGTSALIFMALAVAQMLACRAIGAEVSLAMAAFAVSSAGFIQIMAAAPGGPGITEASLVVIFLALGVDPGSAAAGTFLARLANYAVLLPWGGVAFWRLQRRYGVAPEAEEAGEA